MNLRHLFCIISLLFVAVPGFSQCLERHGALDFGSGTTKALVAEVDVCEKRIVSVLYDERLPIALNEALEKSTDKTIPKEVLDKALPELQKIRQKLEEYKVVKTYAVATAVYRTAQNGSEVLDRMSKDLDLPIQLITQDREAELGYWSALAQKKALPRADFVVWDIGGGSMQMYAQEKAAVHLYKGDLASVTFKNKILEILQFKNPVTENSPNPLGRNKEAAVQIAKNHGVLNVPPFFKHTPKEARWIGVGGVLALSVQKQVAPHQKFFSLEELSQVLDQRAQLSDNEIKSDYRVSDVSNLALVLGYMKALGIHRVETVSASLGEGLIYQNLIKSRSE